MGKSFKYEMGVVLKDIITGFQGVVMPRSEYFTGCNHYGLCPQQLNKDGKLYEWEWLDESRLIAVGDTRIALQNSEPTSGPHPNPPKV